MPSVGKSGRICTSENRVDESCGLVGVLPSLGAICFSPYLYRARNLVERFFNKIKRRRRVAKHCDKLIATSLPSSSSLQYGYGRVLMSPRPNNAEFVVNLTTVLRKLSIYE
jgi:hypothetical protein